MSDILKAETKDHYVQVRALFVQYADALGFDLDFQGFDQEIEMLPGDYAPPRGCIFLAEAAARFVGCVALRPMNPTTCEMKRLFVMPEYRGRGIGRKLARALIDEARKMGYQKMRLDTVASMQAAKALYVSLGFEPIEAYYHNPLEGAAYFELNLS